MKNNDNILVSFSLNKHLKQHLDQVLTSSGMRLAEALRLYCWEIANQGCLPFKGFTGGKFPAKKPDELIGLDAEFHERFKKLRVKMVKRKFTELENVAAGKDPNWKPAQNYDRVKDAEFYANFIERTIAERGYIKGPETGSLKDEYVAEAIEEKNNIAAGIYYESYDDDDEDDEEEEGNPSN